MVTLCRPIILVACICKHFEYIVVSRLGQVLNDNSWLSFAQYGHSAGVSGVYSAVFAELGLAVPAEICCRDLSW